MDALRSALERGYPAHSVDTVIDFAPLRDDPSFRSLLAEFSP